MTSIVYTGDRAERATGTAYLEKRIEINRAYSSVDFDSWLHDKLGINAGENILDVGCGSGAQTLPFAKLVGPMGSVSSLDISADLIELLKSRIPSGARVQAVVADMNDLAHLIANIFLVKTYSLVHSSYALYYSSRRIEVLDVMRGALAPGGRCAIFTPSDPHGLVELASRFSVIPVEVTELLRFGPNILRPYFERHFKKNAVHHFHNVVTVPSPEIIIEFYRQTTYYDKEAEPKLYRAVEEEIARKGTFQYEKNGYLIIGSVDEQ